MESKQLFDQAAKEYADGQAVIQEFEQKSPGQAVPEEKWNEATKHFEEAKRLSERATQLHEAEEFKRRREEPVRTRPVGEGEGLEQPLPGTSEEKKLAEIQKKAFRRYLLEGPAVEWSPDEKKAISGLVDPQGGFLKMEEFRSQIIHKLRDRVQIRMRASTFSTDKESVVMPTADFSMAVPKRRRGSSYTVTDLDDFLGRTRWTPFPRGAVLKVPEDMIDEVEGNFMSTLAGWIAQEYAEIEEDLFLNGSGVEEAIGLLTVSFDTSQLSSGATVTPEDVRDLPYDLRAVHRMNGVWITHREGIRQIMKLRSEPDGANSGQFLWQPSLAAGQPPTLDGFPVLESEFFPDNWTSGSAGDPLAIFGNPETYWIVDGRRVNVRRLDELYAEEGKIGLRINAKMDASPLHKDAFVVMTRGS